MNVPARARTRMRVYVRLRVLVQMCSRALGDLSSCERWWHAHAHEVKVHHLCIRRGISCTKPNIDRCAAHSSRLHCSDMRCRVARYYWSIIGRHGLQLDDVACVFCVYVCVCVCCDLDEKVWPLTINAVLVDCGARIIIATWLPTIGDSNELARIGSAQWADIVNI